MSQSQTHVFLHDKEVLALLIYSRPYIDISNAVWGIYSQGLGLSANLGTLPALSEIYLGDIGNTLQKSAVPT